MKLAGNPRVYLVGILLNIWLGGSHAFDLALNSASIGVIFTWGAIATPERARVRLACANAIQAGTVEVTWTRAPIT